MIVMSQFNRSSLFAFPVLVAMCLFAMADVLKANDNEVRGNKMKIRISVGKTVLTATMLDNATARDFMALMPMTLILNDYARTEKIAYLPRKLSTQGAPSGSDPSVGDITLYAPWGNLAIFYQDFGYASGLIVLGKIDHGVDKLSELNGEAKFEIIQ